jgi:hypothetical protein
VGGAQVPAVRALKVRPVLAEQLRQWQCHDAG